MRLLPLFAAARIVRGTCTQGVRIFCLKGLRNRLLFQEATGGNLLHVVIEGLIPCKPVLQAGCCGTQCFPDNVPRWGQLAPRHEDTPNPKPRYVRLIGAYPRRGTDCGGTRVARFEACIGFRDRLLNATQGTQRIPRKNRGGEKNALLYGTLETVIASRHNPLTGFADNVL